MTQARSSAPRVARLVEAFEALTPADLPHLARWYAPGARFKDPFHDVCGIPAIQQVYAHMYEVLQDPRFAIQDVVAQGDHCLLTWDFTFRFKRSPHQGQTMHGASHLTLDAQGRITCHRDYWDAAEALYEKLPVLGSAMRWVKRRLRA